MHHESWELVKGTVSKFQVSKLCYLHVVFSCRAAWWNCTILPATWPVPQLRSVLFWLLTQWRRSMARKLNEGWSWFFSYFLCFCNANKITMWYIVMGKMRFHAFKCRSANIHVTRCNVFRFFGKSICCNDLRHALSILHFQIYAKQLVPRLLWYLDFHSSALWYDRISSHCYQKTQIFSIGCCILQTDSGLNIFFDSIWFWYSEIQSLTTCKTMWFV